MKKCIILIIAAILVGCSEGTSSSSQPPSPTPTTRYIQLNFPSAYVGDNQPGIYVLNQTLSQKIAYANWVANTFVGPEVSYTYIPLNTASNTVLTFVVPNGSGGYTGCNVVFNPNGTQEPQTNNQFSKGCIPFTPVPNTDPRYDANSKLAVSAYNVGANITQQITIPNKSLLNSQVAAAAVPRTFVFKNSTNNDICLVRDDNNPDHSAPTPDQMCNHPEWQQSLVLAGSELTIPVPVSGWNSASWAVVGYRTSGSSTWLQTGFTDNSLPNRQQAATKIEVTAYPYYPTGTTSGPILNSVAPTSVDISAVDGVNLTYSFYPEVNSNSSSVCNITDSDVSPGLGTQYTGIFYQSFPLTYFNTSNYAGSLSCSPNQYVYTNGSAGSNVGCMSPCSYSKANGDDATTQSQLCCTGAYGSATSCNSNANPNNPFETPYPNMIHTQFPSTYSFAFDDGIANFGCDPFNSFVFNITGVGPSIISN